MSFKMSTWLQEYLVVTLFIAIATSALMAHTGSVVLAMILGYLVSMIIPRILFKSRWYNSDFRSISTIRKYIIASVPAILGSQFAWVACLI